MAAFPVVSDALAANRPVAARRAAVALDDSSANWQEARAVTTLNPGGGSEEV